MSRRLFSITSWACLALAAVLMTLWAISAVERTSVTAEWNTGETIDGFEFPLSRSVSLDIDKGTMVYASRDETGPGNVDPKTMKSLPAPRSPPHFHAEFSREQSTPVGQLIFGKWIYINARYRMSYSLLHNRILVFPVWAAVVPLALLPLFRFWLLRKKHRRSSGPGFPIK